MLPNKARQFLHSNSNLLILSMLDITIIIFDDLNRRLLGVANSSEITWEVFYAALAKRDSRRRALLQAKSP